MNYRLQLYKNIAKCSTSRTTSIHIFLYYMITAYTKAYSGICSVVDLKIHIEHHKNHLNLPIYTYF